MRVFKLFKNFFLNFLNLIKLITRSDEVRWDSLKSGIVNSEVHKQTRIYKGHFIGNSIIEKGTYVSMNARIFNTHIGKFCSIGPNLICGWGIHPTNGISTSPVFYSTSAQAGFTLSEVDKVTEKLPISIGNDVFIGANVIVLDGVTIGDGAVIGAGAVVSKDIPPYAIAVGCPIRVIKYRFDDEIIDALLKSKWWDGDEETLRKVEQSFFEVEKFLGLELKNSDIDNSK